MTNRTWFRGTGAFNNAADWSPNGVPVPGDSATILAGTLQVSFQNLTDIPLTVGGNLGTPVVLDLKDTILGRTTLVNGVTPSATGIHTINVSDIAVVNGPLFVNEIEDSTTINISPHSLLLNNSNITFIQDVGNSLHIAGTDGALLINDGLIEEEGAGSAQLTITPDIIGKGTIVVGSDNRAATEFGGLVGAGQTFEFSTFKGVGSPLAKASLQLDMPKEFQATIADFTSADSIDLKGVSVTSDSFSNGVLTLKAGSSTVAQLHFAGSFTTGDFVTQAVGGDTLVTHA